MTDTKGYIYFVIKTENEDLKLSDFESYLTLNPTKFKLKFENGKTPACTMWELSSGNLTNPDYFKEIEKLINKLQTHKDEFIKLKQQNPGLVYILEVVVFLGDESPGLHFSEQVVKFMNDIGGVIDCDIYNEK